MKYKGLIIIPALVAAISVPEHVSARENVGMGIGKNAPPTINAACAEATVQSDLAVNNVRCRILLGDMWWDLNQNPKYEIPKGGGVYSIFAGSLWIGGIDIGGQLKVAAQTYRQTGNDFWPGPLDTTNASVSLDVCNDYDRHFRITRKEVENFVSTGETTPGITNWPGNGNQSLGQAHYLAPFYDKNQDGVYSPAAGDYPGYDLIAGDGYGDCQTANCVPVDQLFGDETLWWVFNDKGNIHGETSGQPIGLEIRAQAFGFFTDDEINNMTFYNYRIFNRSTFEVDTCYMGVWCDSDLGEPTDDYVGCDVKRGLGYTYNADNDDAPPTGYGANPPALGIDFFRGPVADVNDGKDNNRNCQLDEPCEQIIMSGFLYYDNTNNVPYGNPTGATHFYNYLRMKWGDGNDVVYNYKNGYPGTGTGPKCNFMYPGNPSTDEHDWGIGGTCATTPTLGPWDEVIAGNAPQDRRMLESAGPFTLRPGAVNVITTGVVWARATAGGPQASVKLLKVADDKAQALFDNCFKVLDGPTAPDLTVQELDRKIILYISNTDPNSNNYNENYKEFDPLISLVDSNGTTCSTLDPYYHFEGYKIFQLKNATVSSNDLDDISKARLAFQSDVQNGIGRIINYEFDNSLGGGVPKEKVNGADLGLTHSVMIDKDQFTGGPLINHKTYYFMAVAYGYNQFKKYQQDVPPSNGNMCDPTAAATTGQKKPYKQGRKNLISYSAIPHESSTYSGGTEMHGEYGGGLMVKRIEGNGNGGMNLDFTDATVSSILASSEARTKTPEYTYGHGPIDVKVVDPLNVPDGQTFTLKFDTMLSIKYNTLDKAFQVGETITGATSGATAVVVNDNGVLMHLKSLAGGPFVPAENIKGSTSLASAKISCYGPGKSIDKSTWVLVNNSSNETVYSDQTIQGINEQLLLQWGLSVSIVQAKDPGASPQDVTNDGYIGSSMTFADPSKKWLTGVADKDGPYYTNWIRSGNVNGSTTFQNDYATIDSNQVYESMIGGTWAPYRLCATSGHMISSGSQANFDSTLYYTGPGFVLNYMSQPLLKDLSSVNVVITADKSKWTRCVVLEMAEDTVYAANVDPSKYLAARKFDYRRALSVDKNGSTAIGPDNNDFATGMGWFPGYAINLETGERLNIAFGENSALTKENGNDMKWNPTANQTAKTYHLPWDSAGQAYGSPVFGGQHYIYVFGHNKDDDKDTIKYNTLSGTFKAGEIVTDSTGISTGTYAIIVTDNAADKMVVTSTDPIITAGKFAIGDTIYGATSGAMAVITSYVASRTTNDYLNIPRYDKGYRIRTILGHNHGQPSDPRKREIFRDAMWVNIPLLAAGHSLFESDVTVRLRVTKPYKSGYSPAFFTDIYPAPIGTLNVISDTASTAFGQNRNLPMYTFSTSGVATHTDENDIAQEALDQIRVVPNPYYAYSAYEKNQLDNRVKITNLPEACTVSIYNLSGSLIQKLQKDKPVTVHRNFNSAVTTTGSAINITTWDGSLDWDLKNTAGVPVSSGVYIFHIEVPGVGERVVKWFGVMRPVDLDAF